MSRAFVFIILLVSCNFSDMEHSFFDVEAVSYNDALMEGFERVPVDVELLESEVSGVVLGLQYTNDRRTLLTKSWRFDKHTEKSFIDSVVYSNDMDYLMLPCEVDSVRKDFCLLDRNNRIFIGRSFQQKEESYCEIVYYFAK